MENTSTQTLQELLDKKALKLAEEIYYSFSKLHNYTVDESIRNYYSSLMVNLGTSEKPSMSNIWSILSNNYQKDDYIKSSIEYFKKKVTEDFIKKVDSLQDQIDELNSSL